MKQLFFLLLFSLFFSCSQSDSFETKETVSTTTSKPNELKLVKPDNIHFEYEIIKDYNDSLTSKWFKLGPNSVRLGGKITNNNDFPVFLLTFSCDDIPGHLEIWPKKISTWQFIHCNISYSRIEKINALESYTFSTNLSPSNYSEIDSMELSVKFVDRYVEFEELKMSHDLIQSVLPIPYEDATILKAK